MTAPSKRESRAHTRRRIVAAGLGVVAVVMVVLGLRTPAAPAESQARSRLVTPLWSARRVPGPVVDAVASLRLQTDLDRSVQGTDACFAVDAASRRVATGSPETPRVPASTLKLLTATAALDALGPEFRFETRAVAADPPKNGSVLRLWLVGAGDPSIATPEGAAALAGAALTKGDAVTPLADLADAIVKAGVHSIPGGIVGDDSRYDTARYVPQWPASYRTDREIGPIGALTVNDGFGGPAGRGAATDPAVNAADQLARLLAAHGVAVGPSTRGPAPKGASTVATLRSPPLTDVLNAMLASSHNLGAEMLTRELAVQAGKPGTTANGTAAIAARLTALGLPTRGIVMVDGSGLSADDRVSCNLLLGALDLATKPRFAILRTGLTVAGERGTLATRLRGTPLQGKLVAKTGSLDGVSGLAGFVDVKTPLEFSVLLNGGFSESTGVGRREQVAQVIGRYPDTPDAGTLVPVPAPASVPGPAAG